MILGYVNQHGVGFMHTKYQPASIKKSNATGGDTML
jgi:hypothetical protein